MQVLPDRRAQLVILDLKVILVPRVQLDPQALKVQLDTQDLLALQAQLEQQVQQAQPVLLVVRVQPVPQALKVP